MNQIIIDSSLTQICVALMENEDLVEVYIERKNNRRTVGDIYKGRVTNVLPGMQAAFVDIGLKKNAFLYVKDAIFPMHVKQFKEEKVSIKDILKSGQDIVVQVIKEPMGTKGPRVTTHLTLPGRYLVLMPYNNYVGISRRIEDEEERKRLKKLIDELKPEHIGLIVRTEGMGKGKDDFKEDLNNLMRIWENIEREKKLGLAPRVLYKDLDLLQRTVRDLFTSDIEQLVINDREKYKHILELVDILSPHLKERVKYFNEEDEGIGIFQYYKIENMLNDVASQVVHLKSGGYIVIDQTEALTVIDVNTGKYVGNIDLQDTILKINKEAAEEIAKQLRLRDIGGIIVVDFIDMEDSYEKEEVLEVLQNALDKDKTKTTVLGITKLGLLEMTRKKVRERIGTIVLTKCPYCQGTGSVLSEYMIIQKIEKELKRIALHTNAEAVAIEVNPLVIKVLDSENGMLLKDLENITGLKVFVKGNDLVHANHIKVKAYGSMERVRKTVISN